MRIKKLSLAVVLAAALTVVTAAPANASPNLWAVPTSEAETNYGLSQQEIAAAYEDLRGSEAQRVTEEIDGSTFTTFTLPTGSTMTFKDDEVSAQLGGGWDDRYGLYVDFNRTDQTVLISGGGAALGAAICLIPGAGVPLCIVASAIIGAAIAAISANGLCPNIMRVYAQLLGYPQCR